MTTPRLNAVGFCAHYSEQGDWAFDFALRVARAHGIRLNVFHFLADPYTTAWKRSGGALPADRKRLIVEKERELRFYYDTRAGDYLDVGFRLCEGDEWHELHRCLLVREFQLLVLGYVRPDATFAGKPIEEFADAFVCPVVLIGPEDQNQCRLNWPATLLADQLGLGERGWSRIELVPG